MFWDDHITDNLIKVCDCSEAKAFGKCAELLQVSREDWKKAYAVIAF